MKKKFQERNLPKMAFFALLLFGIFPAVAQEDPEALAKNAKRYMQKAEEAVAENDVASAEAYYRKAISIDPANAEAKYNLGNLYYNKDINLGAVERHGQAAKVAENKDLKHDSFHNRGNAFMKQKKYKEAIEAYKNSLRNNPSDEETRYNLALAKKMLEEEQKKGGGDKNNDQKKDQQDQNKDQKQDKKDQQGDQGEKEKNEDGKPKENKGEEEKKDKKEGQDKKDDQGKPQDKKEEQNQGDKKEQPKQQPQPKPGQLSPQQVKNLLEAMGNEEKKIQEKINAEKVKGAKTTTEKDW